MHRRKLLTTATGGFVVATAGCLGMIRGSSDDEEGRPAIAGDGDSERGDGDGENGDGSADVADTLEDLVTNVGDAHEELESLANEYIGIVRRDSPLMEVTASYYSTDVDFDALRSDATEEQVALIDELVHVFSALEDAKAAIDGIPDARDKLDEVEAAAKATDQSAYTTARTAFAETTDDIVASVREMETNLETADLEAIEHIEPLPDAADWHRVADQLFYVVQSLSAIDDAYAEIDPAVETVLDATAEAEAGDYATAQATLEGVGETFSTAAEDIGELAEAIYHSYQPDIQAVGCAASAAAAATPHVQEALLHAEHDESQEQLAATMQAADEVSVCSLNVTEDLYTPLIQDID